MFEIYLVTSKIYRSTNAKLAPKPSLEKGLGGPCEAQRPLL